MTAGTDKRSACRPALGRSHNTLAFPSTHLPTVSLPPIPAPFCTQLVFISSATVNGQPESVPLSESARLQALNPYGHPLAPTECSPAVA